MPIVYLNLYVAQAFHGVSHCARAWRHVCCMGSAPKARAAPLTPSVPSSENVRPRMQPALDVLSKSSLRRTLSCKTIRESAKPVRNQSMEEHAKQDTENGPTILESKQMQVVEYINPINPMSFVWYLCMCDPANPLRPELTRKLECSYWAFKHWPR